MSSRALSALRASGPFFLRLLGTLLMSVMFVAAGALGVALHANLPAGRRIVAGTVTRLLSDYFQGTVTIGNIERLGTNGLEVDEIGVTDPWGNTVIVLSKARARADLIDILNQVFLGGDKITIAIRHIRAERAEVQIIPAPETGIPTIERTFFLEHPSPESEPKKPGRQVKVWMPNIEVGRVYGRGQVAGLPIMETTVANVRGSILVTPQGVAVDVQRYGVVLRGLAGTDATGTGEVHVRAPGAVWTSFDGYLGNLGVNAFVYVRGDKVEVTLDFPQGDPEDVRALWPDWPLKRPVAAHIEASGEIPILETSGRFEMEGTTVTANGPLTLAGDVGAKLDAQVRGFDLRSLAETAPATDVDADAAVAIWTKKGQVVVDFNGTTYPTTVDDQELPAIDATGSASAKGVTGRATVHEPGMPVKVAFDVKPDGTVDFDAHARRFRIEKAPRAHEVVPAKGLADVRVVGKVEKGKLEADVTADVSSFQYEDVALAQGRVTGTAKGQITKPKELRIDARVEGRKLAAGDMSFDRVKGRAQGPVTRPKLDATLSGEGGPEVTASGTLSTDERPTLHGVEVAVKRGDSTLVGRVERLDLDTRELTIRDVKISGAGGELAGNVRIGKDHIDVKAKGDGIDLDRASRALGLPRGLFGGTLNIDADVSIGRKESKGRVKLALGKGSIADLSGISLSLDGTLEDTTLVGSASALIDDVGSFGAAWETTLAGSPLEIQSWRDMIGRAQVNAINVELSHVKQLLPESARIERIEGKGFGQFQIERRIPAALPSVFMVAGTQGLEVVRAGETEDDEPLHVRGIDMQIGGQIDGASGDASGTTRLVDRDGELVKSSGSMKLDLAGMVEQPRSAGQSLLMTPLQAVIVVPDRPLAELPEPLRVTSLTGVVGGEIRVTGTLADPTITVKEAYVRNLVPAGSRLALPVDVKAQAQYSPKSGQAGGTVEVHQSGRRVALMLAQGRAEWQDVKRGEKEGDAAWTGGTQLVLEGLPLGVFGPLADARVGGELWGTVAVHRPESAAVPLVSANIEVRKASVDLTQVGSGKLNVRSDGKLVNAKLEFVHKGGRLDATGRAALTWDGLVPSIDESRPVHIDAQARRFDAIVLSPFLRDVFSELSGPITANATMILKKNPKAKPGVEGEPAWTSQIHGNGALENGVVQLEALGLELRDVSFGAVARDSGRGTAIEINNVQAKARSNKPNLRARGTIYIEGVRVERASASFSVAEVPLLIQGVSQATATGTATATLLRREDHMEVQVKIPELTAKLPRSSGRNVINIDDNKSIVVVQPLGEPEEASGPAMPWRFVIDLGRRVRVRRNDMDVPITGQPVIEIAEETDVSGFVELEPGGRVQALGKVFVIESGRVRFDTDDPSDPHLAATASWRAPDGSTVYIDVKGTLKEAKVRFTSDPARPEPEIMALLLGGPAPTTGPDEEGAGGGAAAAGSAAVGGAAPIVNELLADSPLGRVEFRTATYEGRSSYTAAVRITESVWFETTYRSRETEQNAPNAERPDLSGTVDWRFRRNWSLRTEVGTFGTGMDLLWQYRY